VQSAWLTQHILLCSASLPPAAGLQLPPPPLLITGPWAGKGVLSPACSAHSSRPRLAGAPSPCAAPVLRWEEAGDHPREKEQHSNSPAAGRGGGRGAGEEASLPHSLASSQLMLSSPGGLARVPGA
jgi:hypothetical protein